MRRKKKMNRVQPENVHSTIFTPQEYQVELIDSCMQGNTVVVLASRSTRTFLVTMVTRELSYQTRSPEHGGLNQCTLIIGKSGPKLVKAGEAIQQNTNLAVATYTSLEQVKGWHEKFGRVFLDSQVIVMTHDVLETGFETGFLQFEHLNLFIITDAHQILTSSILKQILSRVSPACRILAMTSPVLHLALSPSILESLLRYLKRATGCTINTSSEIVTILRYVNKPHEKVIMCASPFSVVRPSPEDEVRRLTCQAMSFLEDHRYDLVEIYGPEYAEFCVGVPDPLKEPKQILKDFVNVLDSLGLWCADRAALYSLVEIEKMKKKTAYDRHYLLLCLIFSVMARVRAVIETAFENHSELDQILNYSTPKVLRLIAILRQIRPLNFVDPRKRRERGDEENKTEPSSVHEDPPKSIPCCSCQCEKKESRSSSRTSMRTTCTSTSVEALSKEIPDDDVQKNGSVDSKDEMMVHNNGSVDSKDEMVVQNNGSVDSKDEIVVQNKGSVDSKYEMVLQNNGSVNSKDEIVVQKNSKDEILAQNNGSIDSKDHESISYEDNAKGCEVETQSVSLKNGEEFYSDIDSIKSTIKKNVLHSNHIGDSDDDNTPIPNGFTDCDYKVSSANESASNNFIEASCDPVNSTSSMNGYLSSSQDSLHDSFKSCSPTLTIPDDTNSLPDSKHSPSPSPSEENSAEFSSANDASTTVDVAAVEPPKPSDPDEETNGQVEEPDAVDCSCSCHKSTTSSSLQPEIVSPHGDDAGERIETANVTPAEDDLKCEDKVTANGIESSISLSNDTECAPLTVAQSSQETPTSESHKSASVSDSTENETPPTEVKTNYDDETLVGEVPKDQIPESQPQSASIEPSGKDEPITNTTNSSSVKPSKPPLTSEAVAMADTLAQLLPTVSRPRRKRDEVKEKVKVHNPDDPDSVCGLVFVNHRTTAKIIYRLLKELSDIGGEFSWLFPQYTVELCKNALEDPRAAEAELKKQEEVLRRFRHHECNVLVSTAVLEEGIDIPNCNLVLRFDPALHYSSYVYSRGRAKGLESYYFHLVVKEEEEKVFSEMASFLAYERVLLSHCGSVDEGTDSEVTSLEADSQSPPYVTSAGVSVSMTTAISLLNRYCAKLPSDTFTRLTAMWSLETRMAKDTSDEEYQCTIMLPINSPLKGYTKGSWMRKKALAKMSAALASCQRLHEIGELSDNLLPVGKESMQLDAHLCAPLPDDEVIEGMPRPGSTKRRQYYYKKVAECLVGDEPDPSIELWVYKLDMFLTCPIPDEQNTRGRKIYRPELSSRSLALVTTKAIPQMSGFPVFTRSGEVVVKVKEVLSGMKISSEHLEGLKCFHMFTFTHVLRLEKYPVRFHPPEAGNTFFIAPLLAENGKEGIDWEFINLIKSKKDHKPIPPTEEARKKFTFKHTLYQDAVVMPWYRNQDQPQYFYVAEICSHLHPQSDFPDTGFESFEKYYLTKYSIQICNLQQPLLDVDHTSGRLNLLTPRHVNRKGVALPTTSEETKKAKRESLQQKQILVPELCTIHPFPASLWRKAVCLPTILYRMNGLLLANELRLCVAGEIGLGMTVLPHGFEWPNLDFGWTLADVLAKSVEASKESKEQAKGSSENITGEIPPGSTPGDGLSNGRRTNAKGSLGGGVDAGSGKGKGGGGGPELEIGTWSNDMAIFSHPGFDGPDEEEEMETFDPTVALPDNLTLLDGNLGVDDVEGELGADWGTGLTERKARTSSHTPRSKDRGGGGGGGGATVRVGSPSNFEEEDGWDAYNGGGPSPPLFGPYGTPPPGYFYEYGDDFDGYESEQEDEDEEEDDFEGRGKGSSGGNGWQEQGTHRNAADKGDLSDDEDDDDANWPEDSLSCSPQREEQFSDLIERNKEKLRQCEDRYLAEDEPIVIVKSCRRKTDNATHESGSQTDNPNPLTSSELTPTVGDTRQSEDPLPTEDLQADDDVTETKDASKLTDEDVESKNDSRRMDKGTQTDVISFATNSDPEILYKVDREKTLREVKIAAEMLAQNVASLEFAQPHPEDKTKDTEQQEGVEDEEQLKSEKGKETLEGEEVKEKMEDEERKEELNNEEVKEERKIGKETENLKREDENKKSENEHEKELKSEEGKEKLEGEKMKEKLKNGEGNKQKTEKVKNGEENEQKTEKLERKDGKEELMNEHGKEKNEEEKELEEEKMREELKKEELKKEETEKIKREERKELKNEHEEEGKEDLNGEEEKEDGKELKKADVKEELESKENNLKKEKENVLEKKEEKVELKSEETNELKNENKEHFNCGEKKLENKEKKEEPAKNTEDIKSEERKQSYNDVKVEVVMSEESEKEYKEGDRRVLEREIEKQESTNSNKDEKQSINTNKEEDESTSENKEEDESTSENKDEKQSTYANKEENESANENKDEEEPTKENKEEELTNENKEEEESTNENKDEKQSTNSNNEEEELTNTNEEQEEPTNANKIKDEEELKNTNNDKEESDNTNKDKGEPTITNKDYESTIANKDDESEKTNKGKSENEKKENIEELHEDKSEDLEKNSKKKEEIKTEERPSKESSNEGINEGRKEEAKEKKSEITKEKELNEEERDNKELKSAKENEEILDNGLREKTENSVKENKEKLKLEENESKDLEKEEKRSVKEDKEKLKLEENESKDSEKEEKRSVKEDKEKLKLEENESKDLEKEEKRSVKEDKETLKLEENESKDLEKEEKSSVKEDKEKLKLEEDESKDSEKEENSSVKEDKEKLKLEEDESKDSEKEENSSVKEDKEKLKLEENESKDSEKEEKRNEDNLKDEEKVNEVKSEGESKPETNGKNRPSFFFDFQPDLETHPGPPPSILLQALTMSNANDGVNLERLETIGDSYLKYAITNYLYCTYTQKHEGKLSYLRSKQVSNLNLYRLGKRKGLGECMVATKFEPHDNWLPPGYFVPRELEEALIDSGVPAGHWNLADFPGLHDLDSDQIRRLVHERSEQIKQNKADLLASELINVSNPQDLPIFIPYNLLTQHSIPDKSISDCVEALIGAYLTTCGPRGALLFMSWLGIKVLPSSVTETTEEGPLLTYHQLMPPPSPLDSCPLPNAKEQLDLLLSGYKEFEKKIGYTFRDQSYLLQAFTHASYYRNRLTDCYQRLEFLGDAVLDYLITRHLFEDKRQHSPGSLTDLRSALVNNTIFACLAVKFEFHKYFRHFSPGLDRVVRDFVRMQEENGHKINEEYYFMEEEECEAAEDIEVPKALGDVFESIAGAIFLDSGGSLDAVWRIYYSMMKNEIEQFSGVVPKSPIRELLETEPETAKFGKPERLVDGKVRVSVEIFGKGSFSGVGRNYRIAKSTAAKRALRHLKKLQSLQCTDTVQNYNYK